MFGLQVRWFLAVPLLLAVSATGRADSPAVGVSPEAVAKARTAAVAFLRTTQQEDGSWTASTSPGISGLVTTSLLRSGVAPSDPMLQKAIRHLLTFEQPDGGIYNPKSAHGNYETSIVLLALVEANAGGEYTAKISAAKAYLTKLQWDDTEGINRTDVKFGGAGYGKTGDRPDLSNTTFLLDALRAAGVGPNDPAMQNALVFVSRCQNLETEANTTAFAARVNDGGFYYTPAAGGSSQAGQDERGGLRSYGSMTYAGLKSMIYAGLKPDDPRVKAAYTWLKKHYTLQENPGMGQQGLYYYYHTFGKALAAFGEPTFVDDKGQTHHWKKELGDHLLSLQAENGGWLNKEPRWMEGDPNMATAYALLTLVYCLP
jgi:hypothetical protein